ncbi:hypothetical protein CEP52_006005 [Fusarium oligoseptatum]|uniref:Uncharacterized protein n=1 Tax=Fusarium oligoseptatum TaxID=2604345 RepID=A0A428TV32_9HYPO|nr:hypothetical protein CEP52_006005 [Fusarium oligoseptatum]
MCWQIVTHTLRCNVRPLIYDGVYARYVDPFAKPVDCNCVAEHNAQIQCPHHGCCYISMTTFPCSHLNCPQTYDLHRYKRPPQQQQIWGVNPIFSTQSSQDEWESLDYIDFVIFSTEIPPQVIDWAPDFIQLMDKFIDTGRQLTSKHDYLAKGLIDIENHQQLHNGQHGILCNNKKLTCPLMKAIKNAEQLALKLRSEGQAMAIEFKRLWDDINGRVVREMVQQQLRKTDELGDVTHLELALNNWIDSMNDRIRRVIIRGTNLDIPGAPNLRLAYLTVRLLLQRIELEAEKRISNAGDGRLLNCYMEARRTSEEMLILTQELQPEHLADFWLPSSAFSFPAAVSFLLRCALETENSPSGLSQSNSLNIASDLLAALRSHKEKHAWDLGDICLAQHTEVVDKLLAMVPTEDPGQDGNSDFSEFSMLDPSFY